MKSTGEKTKIISHGNILTKSELNRWTQRKITLELENKCNSIRLKEGYQLLMRFQRISSDKSMASSNLPEWRKDFNSWAFAQRHHDEDKLTALEISCLFGFFFNELPPSFSEVFSQFPQKIQSKNLAGAALSVIMAISLGFMDFNFLKEFYQTMLFMDYPFSQKVWSEEDNFELDTLLAKGDELKTQERIKEIYNTHIEAGIAFVEKELEHKSLSFYLKWSFERFNGDGFLLNVTQAEFNDLDSIVIHCHSIFPFEVIDSEKKIDIRELVSFENKNENLYAHRLNGIFDKLKIEGATVENDEYLTITGL